MAETGKKVKAIRSTKVKPNSAETNGQEPWIGPRNYTLNTETVLSDAYRLLCLIVADVGIAQLSGSEQNELVSIRDQFIEDELIHLLITTAVMNRMQDDHIDGLDPSFEPQKHICGLLIENDSMADKKESDLCIRDASNKIIHAESICPELEQVDGSEYPTLQHNIILLGRKNKNEWKAILNIPKYVRATFMNFRILR